jgi:hypothetical protein
MASVELFMALSFTSATSLQAVPIFYLLDLPFSSSSLLFSITLVLVGSLSY